MKLSRCHNIATMRRLARRRLPRPVFDYLEGGAEDEISLERNTAAFDEYELLPTCLRDIAEIDLGTEVLGCRLRWPVILSPTGMSRLFHHQAETAVARAAAGAGALYSLSTVATTRLEDVAAASTGPKMYQIYIFKDRGLTAEFVQRCRDAAYDALCLTVDTPIAGNRERDRVSGMTIPPRFTFKSLFSFAVHPRWWLNVLRHGGFELANVAHRVEPLARKTVSVIEYVNAQFDRRIGWRDAEWLAREWDGPLVIKGLLTAADARLAADSGASAVMVSNHGGRQLDGVPAPVDCIAPIADAVGDRLEIICDGGIRRGSHVIKALALGARACSIGRPYLYGLAAGGEAGVLRALEILRQEMENAMALLGCRRSADLGAGHLRARG